MVMHFRDTSPSVTTRSPVLSPLEAYTQSELQKNIRATQFEEAVVKAYKAGVVQDPSERSVAMQAIIARVEETGAGNETELRGAILKAYPEIVKLHGITRVNARDKVAMREFYDAYLPSFPISEERENLKSFTEILKTPPNEKGFVDVADTLKCPLTGAVLGGMNYAMIPESNSISLTYGFLAPEARGLGLSHIMFDRMKDAFATHKEQGGYRSEFPDTLIIIEKNDLGSMTLPNIILDSAGIKSRTPPRQGDDLTRSAIPQSFRDRAWTGNGFKMVDARYIQSSLDGVVEVAPEHEKLVINYLNNTGNLSDAQRERAADIEAAARGDKMEACLALALCVRSDKDTVDARQIIKHQEVFQGISVLADPDNLHKDIYYKAMMADMGAKGTRLQLVPIPVVGGADYKAAEQTMRALLASVTYGDISANKDRTYAEWLALKAPVIEKKLAAAGPQRPRDRGIGGTGPAPDVA